MLTERQEEYFRYCCKDSAVAYENCLALDQRLGPESVSHYHLNLALLPCFLYMELRGILYDKPLALKRLDQINKIIYSLQSELDNLAGVGITPSTDRQTIRRRISETCCHKRDGTTPLKDFENSLGNILSRVNQAGELTPEDIGFINVSCGWSMNVKSPNYKNFLYGTLKLPIQYKVDPDTHMRRPSTDNEALIALQKKSPHRAVELGIQIMELRTRSQMLGIGSDPDGRVRTSYDVVGTVTGRISSRTSPTGSGYNLQTIPDDYKSLPEGHPLRQGMRDLFLADPGYVFFQCDLKGSDGWTIGAHLARLGDSNMLDDLRIGIKPAARICYMLRHGNQSLLGKTRDEVKELLKEIKKDDWDYFACKIGIWGICYLMGPDLLAKQIAEESYGKTWLSRSEVQSFSQAVYSAYRPNIWHRWLEQQLLKRPELLSPSGHLRRFFDRKESRLGQALAHEPQSVTTYATNLATFKLWTDLENRIRTVPSDSRTTYGTGGDDEKYVYTSLRIQPLHSVHDALLGQFKIEDTAWAISKIKSYFANEIIIAGIPITIPFEGHYGRSWGEQDLGTI